MSVKYYAIGMNIVALTVSAHFQQVLDGDAHGTLQPIFPVSGEGHH